MKWSAYIVLAGLVLGLPVLFLFGACSTPAPELEARAAIIDQLYTLEPNPAFIHETTQELEDFGFEVDLYQGNDVTVDLYRKLPTYGYKVIIFRVHSGLLSLDPKVINRTWLFTSEPYSKTKHITEQLTDQVTYAKLYEGAPRFFAISAKFINKSMEGQFSNTAIIMMGCFGIYLKDFAQAFIQKGASTYIAWDVSVLLDYVDDATPVLIEKLFSEELSIGKAVAETMDEKGPDPTYRAVLKYYPRQSGDKTLRQLIE